MLKEVVRTRFGFLSIPEITPRTGKLFANITYYHNAQSNPLPSKTAKHHFHKGEEGRAGPP
jgi:hypothetical protein